MDTQQVRRKRLLELAERAGSGAAVAKIVGCDPSYISQLIHGHRAFGEKTARRIEAAHNLAEGWLDSVVLEGKSSVQSNESPRPRVVPVIDYVQAGKASEIVDAYNKGDGMEVIDVLPETAAIIGFRAFALRVRGDSMSPLINDGDTVIVDPDQAPRPGDIVVAKVNGDTEATLKRYRSRGRDSAGEVFELVPVNENYPTILCNADHPGTIIGPVIERRHIFRR